MNAEEERKLFAELAKRGLKPEVRNATPLDPYAGTSPVSPSSPKPLTWADAGIDTGTTMGRGNPAERSAGGRIPPISPGSTQLPEPVQLGGSNTPQSSIKQLGPVIAQQPGMVVVVPSARDPSYVAKSPSEVFLSDNEPRSPGVAYPPLASPSGDSSSSDTSSSHANVHGPTGRLGARTMMGADANPLLPGDAGVGVQVANPVKDIHRERSWVDPSKSSPFKSPLQQLPPPSHQHAGTTLQSPIATPASKSNEYPNAFNQPQPISMKKPEATDSPGVQKTFPPGFLDAGTRKQRVRSQVVENEGG